MAVTKVSIDADLRAANISDDLRKELAIYRALKPYIGHCLLLNHDLNNPLAGVLGYTELLLLDGDKLTDDQRGSLEAIQKCAERIKTLVDNLARHKISLTAQVDLESVVQAYEKWARPLDEIVDLAENPLGGQRQDEDDQQPGPSSD